MPGVDGPPEGEASGGRLERLSFQLLHPFKVLHDIRGGDASQIAFEHEAFDGFHETTVFDFEQFVFFGEFRLLFSFEAAFLVGGVFGKLLDFGQEFLGFSLRREPWRVFPFLGVGEIRPFGANRREQFPASGIATATIRSRVRWAILLVSSIREEEFLEGGIGREFEFDTEVEDDSSIGGGGFRCQVA